MPTRVREVVARPVVVPLARPIRTGAGAVTQAPLLLIDLHATDGAVGRAYLFAYHTYALIPLRDLVSALADMIRDQPLAPLDLDRHLHAKAKLLGPHGLLGMALSGLDVAAWDAAAVTVNRPLAELLGGSLSPVPVYDSGSLGILPVAELTAEADRLVAAGFRAMKLRLGRPDFADDLAAVRAVRERLPAGVPLMADFNQSLTVTEAIRRGQLLDAENLAWIEEPVRADDLAGTAAVAAAVRTPVQIGENFSSVFQMRDALAANACDYVMPDVQKIGGVTGWLRAAAVAHAAGVEMSSHLFHEVSAHLLAVTPTRHWLEYMPVADPILAEPFAVVDGCVTPPARPGTGLAWDETAVARYLVR